ncbi:MAG: GAF domain-containing protein [Deltaproteobacteria bacterium]|nr:GAF domain-containing protein [Deltaproteobacteria bacterium]
MGALTSIEDVRAALETDPRFSLYPIRSQGEGWIEIDVALDTLVFASVALWTDRARLEPYLVRVRKARTALLLLGTDEEFAQHRAVDLRAEGTLSLVALPLGRDRLEVTLRNYRDIAALRLDAAEDEQAAARSRFELDEIGAIGRALSSERNIEKLLGLILEKARYVTQADAGSVYIVEGEQEDVKQRKLRFKVAQNDSVTVPFKEFEVAIDGRSIVGAAVISREVINIPDLYQLETPGQNPWGFKHDRTFDRKIGYQTRSMLTVPMMDARDEVIGVVQLINRKRRPELRLDTPDAFTAVIPFDGRSRDLVTTLASQAGVALENALLYDEIQTLFEGFVHASVTAIESRDPTTSGHSQRVAELTVGLAKATTQVDVGVYRGVSFTRDQIKQIEYAGLLHDFGKVGVRENVLVKAKKLYEHDRELVLARFEYIRKALEAEWYQRRFDLVLERGRAEAELAFGPLAAEHALRMKEIDDAIAFVLKANEPTVLEQGGFERLKEIAARNYHSLGGEQLPYLREAEVTALSIPRGSLTNEERLEIESHVEHTYNFLQAIPWGRMFKDIPLIAGSHHEKLNGTGYPRRLHAEEIPVQSKMMSISDIFDALTAHDRPYKKAVPTEKALDIIASEVARGALDPELFRIFVDAKVFTIVARPPQ